MTLDIYAAIDDGKIRLNNEDNFIISQPKKQGVAAHPQAAELQISGKGTLLMVADGMGGSNAGEVAARLAIENISQKFEALQHTPTTDAGRKDLLVNWMMQAHSEIVRYGKMYPDSAGMGTTAVVAWVYQNQVCVVWCGDSRFYLFREGFVRQEFVEKYGDSHGFAPVTDDHSPVWEEVLKGNINPEQARLHHESHIILQSLGDPFRPPMPSWVIISLQARDRFLLCSDGLSGMVSDEMLWEITTQKGQNVPQTCQKLVDLANENGGFDNITVILAEVTDGLAKANPIAKTPEIKSILKNPLAQKRIPLPLILSGVATLFVLGLLANTFFFSKKLNVAPSENVGVVKDVGIIHYDNEAESDTSDQDKKQIPKVKKRAWGFDEQKFFTNRIKLLIDDRYSNYGGRIEDLYKKEPENPDFNKAVNLYNASGQEISGLLKQFGYLVSMDGKIQLDSTAEVKSIPEATFQQIEKIIFDCSKEVEPLIEL